MGGGRSVASLVIVRVMVVTSIAHTWYPDLEQQVRQIVSAQPSLSATQLSVVTAAADQSAQTESSWLLAGGGIRHKQSTAQPAAPGSFLLYYVITNKLV